MKTLNQNWVCTDCDNNQYGRQITNEIFEFKELDRGLEGYGEGEFIELSINLTHYSTEEVLNYISAYYKDLKEIEEIYGQDKNWIIAECIFEQLNGLY